MDKKELKFYESPTAEVVELNVEGQLLAGSPKTNPFEDYTPDTPEV
jgi:hypothetical protein